MLRMNEIKYRKVYMLYSPLLSKTYIGSTSIDLSYRLKKHKENRNDIYTCKSKEIIDTGKYNIMLLEDLGQTTLEQAFWKERKWIEKIGWENVVNDKIPITTEQEEKERKKFWYISNKEKILEKAKTNYKENKEQKAEKVKEYRENNQIKLSAQTNCECGGHYQHKHKSAHFKTKKHQDWFNKQSK